MKRNLTLVAVLASLLVLRAAEPNVRPNIVLVMADDQGWGDTGYNGHPELKTPNLAAREPERVKSMTAALEAWMTSVEKSLAGADYAATNRK